jgi:pseudouridine synthase
MARPAAEVPKRFAGTRLDRYLARCGVDSRRNCGEHIAKGFVTVNGTVERDPSRKLKRGDRVYYLNEGVSTPPPVTAALNKPLGYETTMDAKSRRTVRDLMEALPRGVVPCGRLDVRTGGLLLLSNDGRLIHRLTHPRWEVEREYVLKTAEPVTDKVLIRIRRGVRLDKKTLSKPIRVQRKGGKGLIIVLTTGRNREVRRLAERCGLTIRSLERTAYGPIRVDGISRGEWRQLSAGEIEDLYESVGLNPR